jgi:hypothetical protein
VCDENFEFLQRTQEQAVINIEEMSLHIYAFVPAMNTIKVLI